MQTPRILTLAALLCLLCVCRASAQVALPWEVDMQRPASVTWDYWHGETVSLRVAFVSGGSYLSLAGATASLLWQTNGMGTSWWSAAASVVTGRPDRVYASFGPTNDPGGRAVSFFIRVALTNSAALYRASGSLRLNNSPGADPAAMPGPAAWPALAADLAPLVAPLVGSSSFTNSYVTARLTNGVWQLYLVTP